MSTMIAPGVNIDWSFDPLAALARWPADTPALLLHSGRPHPRWASWSLLAVPAAWYRFTGDPGHGRSHWAGPDPLNLAQGFVHRPFADLKRLLAVTQDRGIWVGCLSYDLGRWVEDLPSRAADDRNWPLIELAWCPGYLVYDLQPQQWRACGSWEQGGYPDLAARSPQYAPWQAGEPQSVFTVEAYKAAVARVKEYIAAGDVFQVNLAQRFTAALAGDHPVSTRSLFAHLASVSPAWYGAYLELADGSEHSRAVASTSPELFLEVLNRRVITRPIKGTRPASVPASELLESRKDKAELAMIVDLLRNDLGRVCSFGSVKVTEPRVIESHPTVHHGVATVTGLLRPEHGVADLLKASLPGGSITGAPKVRAMQIIDELEPVRRQLYCGGIGYLTADHACLNIAIRTMLIDTQARRVDFSVGGGIVADSQEEAEYQETLDKAAAIMRTLRAG